MKATFNSDIFSIESFNRPIVVLLNGEIHRITNDTIEKIDALDETIKYTQVCNNTLYIATEKGLYKLKGKRAKRIHEADLSKTTAIAVHNNEELIVLGDYNGLVTVVSKNKEYTYQEHDDLIVGIVVTPRYIFTASEDGIVHKTKIEEVEPKDSYGIGKAIRYMGQHFNKLILIDAQGSVYTLDHKVNDLVREKRVIKKVSDVYLIKDTIYTKYNKEYHKLTSDKEAQKLDLPEIRADGIFEYKNTLHPYVGSTIREWREEKPPTELSEFFEDL